MGWSGQVNHGTGPAALLCMSLPLLECSKRAPANALREPHLQALQRRLPLRQRPLVRLLPLLQLLQLLPRLVAPLRGGSRGAQLGRLVGGRLGVGARERAGTARHSIRDAGTDKIICAGTACSTAQHLLVLLIQLAPLLKPHPRPLALRQLDLPGRRAGRQQAGAQVRCASARCSRGVLAVRRCRGAAAALQARLPPNNTPLLLQPPPLPPPPAPAPPPAAARAAGCCARRACCGCSPP